MLAAGLVGCSAKSPEEKVAQVRSLYKARLNGFIVREEPAGEVEEFVETEISADEPAAEEVAAEEMAEEEGLETLEPVPVIQKVMLDILIQHDSDEKLPGVTVDISMVDGQGNDKGYYGRWSRQRQGLLAGLVRHRRHSQSEPDAVHPHTGGRRLRRRGRFLCRGSTVDTRVGVW
jgi:hypothetical protein